MEISRAATPWKDSAITLWWGGSALVLVLLGLRMEKRYLRYTALALFGCTIFKVFLIDLAELSGLIRVAAFMGGQAVRPARHLLMAANIPNYPSPGRAATVSDFASSHRRTGRSHSIACSWNKPRSRMIRDLDRLVRPGRHRPGCCRFG